MLIVADSSALVALALCGGLTLLDQLFNDVKIPESVFAIVVGTRRRDAPRRVSTMMHGV